MIWGVSQQLHYVTLTRMRWHIQIGYYTQEYPPTENGISVSCPNCICMKITVIINTQQKKRQDHTPLSSDECCMQVNSKGTEVMHNLRD